MNTAKPGFNLSGFADEAGDSIEDQIRATKELGWTCIEARNIQGTNLTDISDDAFEGVEAALSAAGVRIDCFGSAVANWAKDPRSEEDFQKTLGELQRAIPRMKRLGARQLRAMSFQAIKDARPDSMEIEELVVRKVQQLVAICADADILYLHENCANFGGLSWEHTLRLIERIDSPWFRLIFDTGNPVGTFDRRGKPWERQDSLEFFRKVKDYVERIHIKDARFIRPTDTIFNDLDHCWPGEGEGKVAEVLQEALASGFKGTFSIEPHLATVYHAPGGGQQERDRFASYVEYGRRTMALLEQAMPAGTAGSGML